MAKLIFKEKVIEVSSGNWGDYIRDNFPDNFKEFVGVIKDGVACSLYTEAVGEATLLTFEDKEGAAIFNHSASHLLAAAVLALFPETKLWVGPAIDGGFYYDFDVAEPFSPEDLAKIEKKMKELSKKSGRFERFTLPADEAIKLMEEANQPYKVELIEELREKGSEISFYKLGDFVDLCAGPHIGTASLIKAFKLTAATGAYLRGDSKNKMLCRVYGTAFPNKELLEAHLAAIEEAKSRDHNKIGRELKFFTTVDSIGQGLPILLPKGAKVIQLLERFVEDEEEKRGYLLTKTPLFAKSDLYKISGHWDHYRSGMFVIGDEDKEEEAFALRPMTCPFQFMAYLNEMRSYRDLPLRYNETSKLFRNEDSGEMHGLIRVRQFTISEGHLACRPDQVEEEFRGCVELAKFMLDTLGLSEDITFMFSKWDENNKEKYIGEADEWNSVQTLMGDILDKLDIDYTVGIGEAAFYGPKLDIQIKNVHGKEDTLITIQIDFQLAERFGMEYVDADGSKKHPYVIHRTSIGCYERTLALLIEKYAGALPLWLSPTQVAVLPISEKLEKEAKEVYNNLRSAGIRADFDNRNEKIGYKIREAQMSKTPYMIIIGEKEAESGLVSVRSRKEGDLGSIPYDEFLAKIKGEIERKDK